MAFEQGLDEQMIEEERRSFEHVRVASSTPLLGLLLEAAMVQVW